MPRTRRLRCEQLLPLPPAEVFPFFADASNLEAITPPWLGFRILTPGPIPLEEGTLIDYRIRLHGIPIRWTTRIACWGPPHRFVDEQLRGPYALWRHEHRFEAHPAGTRMIDAVDYAHWGGGLVERWFVRPDLERIFAYRRERIAELLQGALAS